MTRMGTLRVGQDGGDRVEALAVGQVQIEQDGVERLGRQVESRAVASRSARLEADGSALRGQALLDEERVAGVVLDHAGRGRSRRAA
jgi:hypothetical protein